jgi:hypothetical protein
VLVARKRGGRAEQQRADDGTRDAAAELAAIEAATA